MDLYFRNELVHNAEPLHKYAIRCFNKLLLGFLEALLCTSQLHFVLLELKVPSTLIVRNHSFSFREILLKFGLFSFWST